jgi:hypothetical protein
VSKKILQAFFLPWNPVFHLIIVSCENIFCLPVFSQKSLKIKTHKTVIFPLFLCGCETWPLTPREERRMRVSENWVLRRIFGPKTKEVAGGWRSKVK